VITVHHLENSQSIRILWLLEELGVDYEIQHYQRDRRTSLAPASFKQLHLVGTSPIISDGDLMLPESNAIVQYIIDKHGDGGLVPPVGSAERVRYLYWMHAAQGSLVPLLYMQLVFSRLPRGAPMLIKPILKKVVAQTNKVFLFPKLNNFLKHIESDLSDSTWFAGEQLSAADIVMGYCMEVFSHNELDAKYPHIKRYVQHMRERPAYKRALEKNGPFDPLAV